MPKYQAIDRAASEAFEAALRRQSGAKTITPSVPSVPINAADVFAAALQGNNVMHVASPKQSLDTHYEREYCRKGEWQRGWKSALSRENPPTCRNTWEADMREALLRDCLSQTSPL